MRVVADTNVVVSGLLWTGAPHQLLQAAGAHRLDLFTSSLLLSELDDVLQRPRFADRIQRIGLTPRDLVLGYGALAILVEPVALPGPVAADPDDDEVLACALGARADLVASGDRHLLAVGIYAGMPILTPNQVLAQLTGAE